AHGDGRRRGRAHLAHVGAGRRRAGRAAARQLRAGDAHASSPRRRRDAGAPAVRPGQRRRPGGRARARRGRLRDQAVRRARAGPARRGAAAARPVRRAARARTPGGERAGARRRGPHGDLPRTGRRAHAARVRAAELSRAAAGAPVRAARAAAAGLGLDVRRRLHGDGAHPAPADQARAGPGPPGAGREPARHGVRADGRGRTDRGALRRAHGGRLVTDVQFMVLVTVGCSVVAAVAGLFLVRSARRVSLRVGLLTSTLIPVAGVVAALAVNVHEMFLSAHDAQVVWLVRGTATALEILLALALGRMVAQELILVADGARQLAEIGAHPGGSTPAPAPETAELALLMSELEATRERLVAARAAEQQAQDARRQVIGFVSHDLVSPLSGIRAATDGLRDDAFPDPRTALDGITAAVD